MIQISPESGEVKSLVLQSLEDLFKGHSHQLLIQNYQGSNIQDLILYYLGLLSPYNDYTIDQIGYLDLYFENANGAEDVLLEKLQGSKIAVIDGSEHIERFPRLRDALRVREGTNLKTVFLKLTRL